MRSEVRGPGGDLTDCVVTDNADGTYAVEYTPYEKGKTLVYYTYTTLTIVRSLRQG